MCHAQTYFCLFSFSQGVRAKKFPRAHTPIISSGGVSRKWVEGSSSVLFECIYLCKIFIGIY
uniref:Uncharacterized protein n=1 Tax=Anguilla anguilla TaxID=7936 RepID=A0A0E9W7E3_ANGAN